MATTGVDGGTNSRPLTQEEKDRLNGNLPPKPPKPPKVNTGGGTSSGTVAPQATYNPYADMLKQQQSMYDEMVARQQQQFEAEQRAREEALAQQKAQAEAAYNGRVKNVNSGADEMLRQAYILKRQNERTMPQYLKGLGISGGASETTLQNLNANYENNRQKTEAERLAAIDQAAADRDALKQTAYADFLQSNIASLKDYNSQYNDIMMAKTNAEMNAMAAAAANTPKSTTYSSSDVMKSAGYKYAADLLGAGYSNEQIYTTLKNAGYQDAQIAEYLYLMGF